MTLLTTPLLTMTLLTAKVGDGKAEELWKLSQKYAACKSRESPNPNPKPCLNLNPSEACIPSPEPALTMIDRQIDR